MDIIQMRINTALPFAGVAFSDSLTVFVAMKSDYSVKGIKFFTDTSADALRKCPYRTEFLKQMVCYEGSYPFARALKDFCATHEVTHLGFNPKDVAVVNPSVQPVPVDPQSDLMKHALDVLWRVSDSSSFLRLSAKEVTPATLLDYYIKSLSKIKGPDYTPGHEPNTWITSTGAIARQPYGYVGYASPEQSTDRPEPCLALLHAIIATGDIQAAIEERTRKQVAVAKQESELAVCQRINKSTVQITTRWGDTITVAKEHALKLIKIEGAHLAPEELANAPQ